MSNIKTPILILHGENDDVVHISHARSFHHGCLYRRVECELVVYPREGHGEFPPFERMHYIDTLKRMEKFYAKHLKGSLNELRAFQHHAHHGHRALFWGPAWKARSTAQHLEM